MKPGTFMLGRPRRRPWSWMSRLGQLGALGLVWALTQGGLAALGALAEPPTTARSYSGQFVVQAFPGVSLGRSWSNLETNPAYIQLEPTLVPVSCERLKQELWRQLEIRGSWQGKISIALQAGRGPDDPIVVFSERFRDGWQYRVELPLLVGKARYLRAMVQVLLLEYANRGAAERAAEPPLWLVEGLAEQLLRSSELTILLPPPKERSGGMRFTPTIVEARRSNPLEPAHQTLSQSQPLTFEELSWPGAYGINSPEALRYRHSAQLFVTALLGLPEGRACVRRMLELLPRYHNWQFAFLEAFQRHFQRPLDVEKWWSLYQVHFTGRDLTHTWPIQDSWEKLQQALLIPVQVHAATNQVPLGAEVTLQTVLRDWEPERQAPALEAKLRELAHLRVRVALDLAALVNEYCIVLGNYLKAGHRGSWFSRPRRSAAMERAANEAIRQLDLLDVRVNALRPVPAAVRELRMKGVPTGSAGTNLPAPQVTPRPNAPAR